MKRKGAVKTNDRRGSKQPQARSKGNGHSRTAKADSPGRKARSEPVLVVSGRSGGASGRRPRQMVVELDDLRVRLAEAEATLSAIRGGEVDALVIGSASGEKVYTLQGAETPYRVLVEQMQEGAVTLGATGVILYSNQRFAELVGLPLDQVLGTPLARYVASEVQPQLREFLEQSRRGRATGEFTLSGPGATCVDAILTASALPSDEANRICLVVTDLTEHKHKTRLLNERTEELERSNQALRLSERLAAVGTLAAGLGHDMGNMLLPIRMRLDALDAGAESTELQADIMAIRKCTDHLQRLVAGVRLLSLDPDVAPSGEGLVLQECWPDVEAVARTVLPSRISLETDFPADLPPLMIARSSFAQVIFNLVHNAADALAEAAEGGLVRISAGIGDDGLARICVADNGPGMTEEVQRRCLEPFFTTKVRRFNTGLGLALVHSVVQRAGGRLEIDSRPGSGCTITLVLRPATGADCPQKVRSAALSIMEPRAHAFFASCLAAMGVAIASGDNGQAADAADLWVATATPQNVQAAQELVRRRETCQVILLDADPFTRVPQRVTVLPKGTGLAQARAAVESAVSEMNAQASSLWACRVADRDAQSYSAGQLGEGRKV